MRSYLITRHLIARMLVAGLAMAALSSCRAARDKPEGAGAVGSPAPSDVLVDNEMERQAAGACRDAIVVFDGSIAVNSNHYVHPVERGDDFVDEPIDGVDRVVTPAAEVRFTLDYPFERPFAGVVSGPVTLRRTIDAIRAGFRQMYVGATQRDIPGLENKDVTGPYGRAFHVIDDLVIEQIELCADGTFSVGIGS